jgi:malate/lactate dehydrogenase
MFRDNAAVIEAVLGELPGGWIGTVLIATNPVDPLCTLASRRLSPDATVLGYSLHDSLRLTEGIAIVLGCAASEVTAWVVGEHGPDMVPLFERTQLHGHPVVLDQRQRHEALTHALNWYDDWQRCGTGMTSALCSGTGIAHMLERLLAETTSVLPACAQLRGEYGLSGVSLGVPVRLGRGSAEVEQWQLTKGELAAMHRSSQVVAGVVG